MLSWTFLRLASPRSPVSKTSASLALVLLAGFASLSLVLVVLFAFSRRARCRATRSKRSGSLHFASFLRSGFIAFAASGWEAFVSFILGNLRM